MTESVEQGQWWDWALTGGLIFVSVAALWTFSHRKEPKETRNHSNSNQKKTQKTTKETRLPSESDHCTICYYDHGGRVPDLYTTDGPVCKHCWDREGGKEYHEMMEE